MGKLLKVSVNGAIGNRNLIPFGAIVIHATEGDNPSSGQLLLTFTGNGQTISVSSDGYFSETYEGLDDPETRLTTLTLSDSNQKSLWFKNGTYDIYVTGKYGGLSTLGTSTGSADVSTIFSVDTSEFKYDDSLESFIGNGQSNFTGNVDNIIKAGTQVVTLLNTQIEAKLLDFSDCVNITTLALPSTSDKDEIMDFVSRQVTLGRTSYNNLSVQNIKNAGVLRGVTLEGSGSNASLSWNTASKVIVGIGNRKLASCAKVYAYGATAEEIAAWEQAGKTVVVVN